MTGSAAPNLDHAGGWAAFLARRRVALGFLTGVAALLLSSPTWASWRAGLLIAIAGEAVRVWAAGHLEKSREVTSSGPYRFTRHPLYVGSTLMAVGVVVASRSAVVAGLAAVYMGTTIAVAVRTEEAFLRQTFGEAYDRYRRSEVEPNGRRFSVVRARRNGEHRTLLGLAGGFALLALKMARAGGAP
jgi:protein-S-isoprenylcysteine O-methyltransferase Ste14